MSSCSRTLQATPEQVWEVLADGWLYPLWVVGASRMREVDDHWPAVGARLHHSVGSWPVLVDDSTTVLDSVPGRRLGLQARGWPAGEARVDLRLEPREGGTEVVISEDATHGPGVLVPSVVRAPLIAWRNTEALRRLAFLAERRHSPERS